MSRGELGLGVGRAVFGVDPAGYQSARPPYPEPLWARLAERCGLGSGAAVFEVGPGAGLATARLLAAGVDLLLGIEPDARMAAHLEERMGSPALDVLVAAFEDAVLPEGAFDLGVSATAFHWIDQRLGLAKARQALRPGGWWAMWWNNFGDVNPGDDPFHLATGHLFADTARPPAHGSRRGLAFALDREARLADLAGAGFVEGAADLWTWTSRLATEQVVALYATFSPILSLPSERRAALLDSLAGIAETQFGGVVERRFSTSLYSARRPD